MSTFRKTPPPAALRPFIECLWWSRRAAPSSVREHMLPGGTAQLVIALHEHPIAWSTPVQPDAWHSWTRGVLHGPQSAWYHAGAKPAGVVMGVSFRAGAAASLIGVPLPELLDRHVTLEELWGSRGRFLQERLSETVDAKSAFDVLEREMLSRLHRPLLIHPAVAHALRESATAAMPGGIERVRRETGYSHRRFIELFRSGTGLAPKQFYRIQRFSSVVRQLAAGETKLADLAASAGFADQSHLTREFRELAGIAPTAYRPRSTDSAHHHVRG
jgi:AraC-like DNA-binding protein